VRFDRSDELMSWAAVSSSAVGGPVAARGMGRGRSSGAIEVEAAAIDGSSRATAVVGALRSIEGRRDASRSRGVREITLGLEDRTISLVAFRSAGPMRRFAPSVLSRP
jgi:hypothetical protein